MTGRRWFLTTPEQYEQAPIGTQVWATYPDGKRVDFDGETPVYTKGVLPLVADRRREVLRWGTDQDHQRACASVAYLDSWSLWLRSHT